MRKLYQHINHINIRGKATELTKIVQSMDERMQTLANDTQHVEAVVRKYTDNNKGDQYTKAVQAVSELSKHLYESSETMNDMQRQIVDYQNKIFHYEEQHMHAQQPKRHEVRKINVETITHVIEFRREEMLMVYKEIMTYVKNSAEALKRLRDDKNNIGQIWLDEQYKIFDQFIEGVVKTTIKHGKVLEDYAKHLKQLIGALTSGGTN